MKTVIHRADSRGHADHGWLNSFHTFSFAGYQHPERVHFGALRVLNDDTVAPGRGFGTHPHDNMEIISIPLEGDLEHKDSMGNVAVIREGELQVMSAGTGIFHSEHNKNQDREVKFLQIWVFPNKNNVAPRYDQISLRDLVTENKWCQVLSPDEGEQGVWIHQDAWFHMGNLDPETSLDYTVNLEGNGLYVFVLNGEVEVAGAHLESRDGMGIWDTSQIPFRAVSESRLLLMEVPMNLNNH
jgi:redox-sensitive bicupin YhaK (pirin superfamily)